MKFHHPPIRFTHSYSHEEFDLEEIPKLCSSLQNYGNYCGPLLLPWNAFYVDTFSKTRKLLSIHGAATLVHTIHRKCTTRTGLTYFVNHRVYYCTVAKRTNYHERQCPPKNFKTTTVKIRTHLVVACKPEIHFVGRFSGSLRKIGLGLDRYM